MFESLCRLAIDALPLLAFSALKKWTRALNLPFWFVVWLVPRGRGLARVHRRKAQPVARSLLYRLCLLPTSHVFHICRTSV